MVGEWADDSCDGRGVIAQDDQAYGCDDSYNNEAEYVALLLWYFEYL